MQFNTSHADAGLCCNLLSAVMSIAMLHVMNVVYNEGYNC